MKCIIKLLTFALSLSMCSKIVGNDEEIQNNTTMATYYVSTTGSDSGTGTISDPWATWQYGFNRLSPGDILYIRGGTYTPTSYVTSTSRNCAVLVSGKNGTSGNKYQVFAYSGEVPILDCRNIIGTNERVGIFILNSSYWHLKGLTVTRVDQPVGSPASVGGQGILIWGINSATYNTIEWCTAHHCGGPGMGTRDNVNETHFLNCDSYENWDAYSTTPGGNADGFDVGYSRGIKRFTGCRAWWNGDDGFDMYDRTGWFETSINYLVNCWASHHGYSPTNGAGGDGSGFKLGTGNGLQSDNTIRRYLYNCIAYDNKNQGFDQNSGNMRSNHYNCISYDNTSRGFDFHWQNQYDTFRNCVSYSNGTSDSFLSNVIHDHNSWDSSPAVTVSNADFVSITSSQLTGARQSNGNLPILTFLHLITGSDLIGAGSSTDIYATDGEGKLWTTPNPSLGAFEYGTGGIPVSSVTVTGTGGATTISTDNGTLQMLVAILPINATNQAVTWSRTNGSGTATINVSGLLTAVTDGTVTVRATAQDGTGLYGERVITISNQITPVTSITTTGTGGATTISVNDGTLQMVASVLPVNATNASVTWSVTNGTGTATISGTGLLTALTNGDVTVRATAADGSGVYDDQVITISNQIILVSSITVSGTGGATAINIDNGTLQMLFSILPASASNKTVTWSRINGTGTATIGVGGLLTAITNGNVTVRATATDGSGVYDDQVITISNQAISVSGITVSGTGGATTISVNDGTLQMLAAVLPVDATNQTVTWTRINGSGTASISSSGLLTALTDGTVTVRASAQDGSGIYDDQIITLSNQVTLVSSIVVIGTGYYSTIDVPGGTLQMIATVLPADANDPSVTWSRVNGSGTANISVGGLLTALTDGTVTVRATANDASGVYDDHVITITHQTIEPILVSSIIITGAGGATTITVDNGTLQMSAEVLPVNATDPTFVWSVEPISGIAEITPTGLLTAIGNGQVMVKAISNN